MGEWLKGHWTNTLGRWLIQTFLVAGVVDLGDVEGLLGVLALEVVLALAERTGLLALHLLGAAPFGNA